MRKLLYKYRPTIYALFLIGLLFLCLPLAQMITQGYDKKLIVRTIDVVAPTPPPPENPDEQMEMQEEMVELQEMVEAVPLEALEIDLNPNVSGSLAVAVKPKNFKVQMDLMAEIKTFDLAELDNLPRLLNRPLYNFPRNLSRRGIKKSVIEVTVIIHENGRLTIENFTKLNYPELKPAAEKWIRQALFSVPKKDGVTVKGKFLLPLELKDDT